jgi:diguanylate cyclase (GGDEF)-like protein/PAS domain S-box-containing protein
MNESPRRRQQRKPLMMQDKSKTKRELIDELAVLRRQVATPGKSDDLRKPLPLLSTAIESTADGILIVDRKGNILLYNQKFLSLWRIPETVASAADDRQLLDCVMDQLNDPDAFLNKVEQLYEHPEAESFDTLDFKDGRVFERYSKPHKIDGEIIGRVWSFHDVSELKRMVGEQHRNREIAERLAEEMAIIAEIGRLIGSTLDINEVYKRLTVEAQKLIPFDRLSVTLINPDQNTLVRAYLSGFDVPELTPGTSFPMQGSISETLMRTRTGLILHPASVQDLTGQYYHRLVSGFKAGIRSFMSVPLISRDEMIGSLHFQSKKPDAYTERDLRLAEGIGTRIAGAIANARLFTDLQRTENSLRESEGRFRALVEQAAVGVAEIDVATGRYITVNRRFCEMLGRTEAEMLATTFLAITHPDDLHLHDDKLALLLAGKIKNFTLEKRYIRKDGESVWTEHTVSTLWKPGETTRHNIAVIQDITERKRLEEEIREMSLRDLLTELYNRRGFITLAEQQLKAANRAQRPLQLAFIDCDRLKWINDNLGHEEGDKVLIDTANILRQTFRESDIIARLGGDEFAILVIDITDLNPEAFAKRLQHNIDACNAKEYRQYKLSLSWGAAIYNPESPTSLDQLISAADKLMYDQKKTKSNKTH